MDLISPFLEHIGAEIEFKQGTEKEWRFVFTTNYGIQIMTVYFNKAH